MKILSQLLVLLFAAVMAAGCMGSDAPEPTPTVAVSPQPQLQASCVQREQPSDGAHPSPIVWAFFATADELQLALKQFPGYATVSSSALSPAYQVFDRSVFESLLTSAQRNQVDHLIKDVGTVEYRLGVSGCHASIIDA